MTKLRETEADRNDYTQLFALPDTVVADLVDTYGLDRPGGQLLRLFSTFSNFLFVFNPDRPALTGAGRAGLRKAVNYALDRRALTRAHTHLTARPSDRLLPAALSQSRPLYPLGRPDLVRAREWLERAGRPPPRLTLYTWNIPFGVATAQVFAASLKPLGIEVDFRYFGDFGTLVEQLHARRKQWDVLWLPMQAAHTDPAGVLLPLLRGTRYEAAINAANGVPGAAARAKAWADLEANLMLNDPPVAAYADATSLSFVSRNFGCWIAPGPAALDLGAVCRK
jgi:ABC-type transport system substrate-binding protein